MWKKIPNTQIYYASDDGQIKTKDFKQPLNWHDTKTFYIRKGKILKQSINTYGYPCVGITFIGEKRKVVPVHRLIALTFLPKPTENQTQVNHIDGNKLNNSVSNLEWCTASENLKHAYKMGLNKPTKPMLGRFGKNNPKSIPIIMCDLQDNEIKRFDSMMDASRETNISVSKICACVNGKRKSTGGYHWKNQ